MTDPKDTAVLMSTLTSGTPLIMDGAMGTELDRRGTKIASKDWVASTLGAPEDLDAIHQSYARAGAQLHIANTFAAGRHVLAEVGLADQFEVLNRSAVEHCRQAITAAGPGPYWIAGSLSTYMIGSDRGRLPPKAELAKNSHDQAALLADAGCHMIVLEMLHDVEVSLTLMRAAQATGLPVSVGLTVVFGADVRPVLRGLKTDAAQEGQPLEAALPPIIDAMADDYPWILTIMHSDLPETDVALKMVRERWSGPTGVYPNAGMFTDGYGWDHRTVCSPEDFADRAELWADLGAGFIGGCCGLGPEHIRALAGRFDVGGLQAG